jgi:hypothetical protein
MTQAFAFVTAERDLALANLDGSAGTTEIRPLLNRSAPALAGQDGSSPLALTAPTWSPDGASLAVSVRYSASPLQAGSTLATFDLASESVSLLFQGTPGIEGLIAPDLPHCVNWSPDGRHLALLTQTPAGMTLFVLDQLGLRPPTPVVSGAPLFFAWSPSGDALVVHRANDLMLVPASSPESPSILARGRIACQLPAWSTSGDWLAIARNDAGGLVLSRLSRDGGAEDVRLVAGTSAALMWRPGTQQLAYTVRAPQRPGLGRGVWLTTLEGDKPEKLTDLTVEALVWSSEGSTLAILSPVPGSELCAWSTIEMQSGIVHRFAPFYRSAEFALMLAFFDQYAPSHRFMSSDGQALLVSGRVPNNGTPPDSAQSSLYVQSNRPEAQIAFAAHGTFASWRPAVDTGRQPPSK